MNTVLIDVGRCYKLTSDVHNVQIQSVGDCLVKVAASGRNKLVGVACVHNQIVLSHDLIRSDCQIYASPGSNLERNRALSHAASCYEQVG